MSDELVAAALERWARERGEDPLLFFRDARGHFRWWSAKQAQREFALPGQPAGRTPREERAAAGDPHASLPGAFLRSLAGSSAAAAPLDLSLRAAAVAEAVGLPPTGTPRDIWISWRPLTWAPERAVAAWALAAGAAIVIEPAADLPPWLVAWARPTLLTGDAETHLRWIDGVAREAPRLLAGRWLRQRFARLRAVLVEEGGEEGAALDAVRRRLIGLGTSVAPRIVPFPRLALE